MTEVSYLGFVYGTMAALALMRPRGPGHDRAGRFGARRAQHPAAVGLLRGQARHQRLHLLAALRAAARGLRRARHRGADARRQHAAVLLGAVPAAPTIPSRCRRSTSPRSPPAGCCTPPTIPGASSTGWAPAPRPRSSPTGWPRPLLDRYLARTGYDSQQTAQPVEPGRPDNLLPARRRRAAGRTTARTASSTTGPTTAARSCGCPSTPACPPGPGRGGRRRGAPGRQARPPPVTTRPRARPRARGRGPGAADDPGRLRDWRWSWCPARRSAWPPAVSPGKRTRRAARVLGARHLVQAALTAAAPRPGRVRDRRPGRRRARRVDAAARRGQPGAAAAPP